MTSLLDEKVLCFFLCHCSKIFEIFFVQHFQNKTLINLKPGLRKSRKDRKHMFADSFPRIFAIDMLTALKPLQDTIASMLCDCYDYKNILRPGLTKINLRIKTSPAFPLFLVAYSYRQFKKCNKAPLNYSLGGLCRFPSGGYTHAALETV